MVFDCHYHVGTGMEYDIDCVGKNIIHNTVEDYLQNYQSITDTYHSIIFDYKNHFELVYTACESNAVIAVKLHSRLQRIQSEDLVEIGKKLSILPDRIAVIYDAFYYGTELNFQPNLHFISSLISRFPQKKFIIAHAGGYEVLKYFFHLRPYKNVGYDLSFSLLYLHGTSCFLDLKKLIQYTDKSRLFFGTDFPFASPSQQLALLKSIFADLHLNEAECDRILRTNFLNFLNSL